MGRHRYLPWMGAGQTPVPSGADGATSLITRGNGLGGRFVAGRERSTLRKQSRLAERREARVLPSLR